MTGAAHHRGSSKQDYRTPDDFREAITERFGLPGCDLACDEANMFGGFGLTEQVDSLKVDWGWGIHGANANPYWLNPPFGNIEPWAEKCAESGVRIVFLVPASIGSNWFMRHVHHKAMVLGLNPRMSFDGKNPYPKDLMLCLFGFGYSGFDVWRWK